MAGTATAPVKTTGAELLSLLGEQELPIAEAVKVIGEPALSRAWAAGEIEFGHTKFVMTNSPGLGPDEVPDNDRPFGGQKIGLTVIIENGMEWSGEKTKFHGRFKDVLADAVMPEADFYQVYRQEVCTDRRKNQWRWLEPNEAAGKRELRWVRVECSKAEAAARFVWLVKLTDKGLSKLLGD